MAGGNGIRLVPCNLRRALESRQGDAGWHCAWADPGELSVPCVFLPHDMLGAFQVGPSGAYGILRRDQDNSVRTRDTEHTPSCALC